MHLVFTVGVHSIYIYIVNAGKNRVIRRRNTNCGNKDLSLSILKTFIFRQIFRPNYKSKRPSSVTKVECRILAMIIICARIEIILEGLCLHIFLIDLQNLFILLNVKDWPPRVVSVVSLSSNQLDRLAPATDQYLVNKYRPLPIARIYT